MKRFAIILLIICAMLIVLTSLAQVKSKTFSFVLKKLLSHKVPEISVNKAALSANSYIFLDAREKDEYTVSHLAGAIYVGYNNFDPAILKDVPTHKPIIVYCSVGKRSENIAEMLIKQGYKNVSNLYGGIFEWVNEGHAIYDIKNKPTENVHAYNRLWGRFLDKGNKVY